MSEISSMCRVYPRKITASELVGRAFLLTRHLTGSPEKAQLVVQGLGAKELESLSQAVHYVLEELEREDVTDFKLGQVILDTEGRNQTIFVDLVVPRQFVKDLERALEKAKAVGSSAAG